MAQDTFDLRTDARSSNKAAGKPKTELTAIAAEVQDMGLDSDRMNELHRDLLNFYRVELDRQDENRRLMARDEDYYDHVQFDDETAALIRDRGQTPIVYNVIANTVNWVIGTEKRGRTDFKVLPRRKEDGKAAEKKTSLLKYLSDVNRTAFNRSRAFEDSVKVGLGWLETGVQDESEAEEPIYDRYESWRNIIYDSASTELDGSDMRYMFRSRFIDADVLMQYFPNRSGVIDMACDKHEDFGLYSSDDGDDAMDGGEIDRSQTDGYRGGNTYARRRVRVIEAWFTNPEKVKVVAAGVFKGEIYDENDSRHIELAESLAERPKMRMRCCIMTSTGILYEGPSPYRHNKFPFIPIWGYRRGRNGLPYGMIRGLVDIQDDINKRAAKAAYILNTNKVIMEEGAVDDIQKTLEEVARPDGLIVVKNGKRFEMNADRGLDVAHLDMMSREIQMIQQVGGVTDELLGRSTNAQSGVAIQSRQEQGQVGTMKFFDNLRFAEQLRGEITLSLIEQFMTEQKQFRITNQRGNADFVDINDGLPENDIARSKADFVISEQEWQASIRQAAANELMAMVGKMPAEVGMVILDLMIENMDLPNRDEIVKRIRQSTGMRDPDATEMTPEEMQAQQAAMIQQQIQQQLQAAQIREAEAKAAGAEAQVEKTRAEIDKVKAETVYKGVESMSKGVETAANMKAAPDNVAIADEVLRESGFKGETDKVQEAAMDAANQQEAAMQAQAQQAETAQMQASAEQAEPQQTEVAEPPAEEVSEQPAPEMAQPQQGV